MGDGGADGADLFFLIVICSGSVLYCLIYSVTLILAYRLSLNLLLLHNRSHYLEYTELLLLLLYESFDISPKEPSLYG